jgi:hypothetical protein
VRPGLLLVLGVLGCAGGAPHEETIVIPGTPIRIEMVYVSGDARLRPFWISKREVTWAEFDRFYQYPEEERIDGITRPSSGKNYLQLSGVPAEQMEGQRPVSNLRYHSAISYCEWLSWKTGLLIRLPTEVEWLARPMEPEVWQYCLEPDQPPDFGPVLRGRGRTTPSPLWDEADPNRPLSTWWYRTGQPQGFRIVRVPEESRADVRSLYATKIRISGLRGTERSAKWGKITSLYSRVTGEVTNDGDRTLEELLLKVYSLTPKGKPHFEDVTSGLTRRATFNLCVVALGNSAHPGVQARPLEPGESRSFEVEVPASFDAETDVDPERFGASVLHVQFAH